MTDRIIITLRKVIAVLTYCQNRKSAMGKVEYEMKMACLKSYKLR